MVRSSNISSRHFSPNPDVGIAPAGRGIAFLKNSGISASVIEAAVAQGVLSYAEGALVFAGASAHRGVSTPISYPYCRSGAFADVREDQLVVLRGDPRRLWIVEQTMDALHLWTVFDGLPWSRPTILAGPDSGLVSRWQRDARIASAMYVVVMIRRPAASSAAWRTTARLRMARVHRLVNPAARIGILATPGMAHIRAVLTSIAERRSFGVDRDRTDAELRILNTDPFEQLD